MKNSYRAVFIFMMLFEITTTGYTQTAACNSSVTLSTQAQVDAWPITHGCSLVLGDLTISGADITHLDSLYTLQNVNSKFYVGNTLLTDLNGLINFRFAKSIKIQSNPNLISLEGFTSIEGSWDTLDISSNPKLESLQGLSHLSKAQRVRITNNPKLKNLVGLENVRGVQSMELSTNTALSSVEALRGLTGGVSIDVSNNASLPSLDGLNNISSMEFLRIRGNTILTNIDALSSVTELNGFNSQILILYNPALANLNGLSSLTKVGGTYLSEIVIQGNAVLADVNGLASLTDIFSPYRTTFNVQDNPQLGMCCGVYRILEKFSNLGGNCTNNCASIDISGNTGQCTESGILHNCIPGGEKCNGNIVLNNQSSIDAFPSSRGCTTMTGTLTISSYYGGGIYNLDSLSSLISVDNLIISNNNFLVSLEGLGQITRTKDLVINTNDQVKNSGLKSLQRVDGDFQLINNSQLTEVGTPALTSIGGSLYVESQPKLDNINVFRNITSLGGRLQIRNNNMLTNLDGLSALNIIGNDSGVSINLEHNINLQWCCGLSGILTDHHYTGSVYIAGNGASCTQSAITAEGPCCPPGSTYPLDKIALPEKSWGVAPVSTNIIIQDYQPGIFYTLRVDNGNILAAGPQTGDVGLFVQNINVDTEFNVVARDTATNCSLEMTVHPFVHAYQYPPISCSSVPNDKQVVAEQDSGPSGMSTNIIVLNGDDNVVYALRQSDQPGVWISGAYPSSVGLYTGTLSKTTTFSIVAIDVDTHCSQDLSTLITITIDDNSSPATRIASDVNPNLEKPVNHSVIISPNPSSGEFDLTINRDFVTQCYFTVSDMVGRNIAQKEIHSSESLINVHMNLVGVPAGIYILSIQEGNGAQTVKKIIIK